MRGKRKMLNPNNNIMKESEMMIDLIENLLDLEPVEFVEEYNRQMGANLIVDEVEFDGERLKYTIGGTGLYQPRSS